MMYHKCFTIGKSNVEIESEKKRSMNKTIHGANKLLNFHLVQNEIS